MQSLPQPRDQSLGQSLGQSLDQSLGQSLDLAQEGPQLLLQGSPIDLES